MTAAQQTLPRDTPRSSSARTLSVSGRVTDRDTGQPLRRITIRFSLRGRETLFFVTTTNSEGRYELADVPAGEYDALAGPDEFSAGYTGKRFGAGDRPSAIGLTPPLVLKPGESRNDIDFVLARTFAIEGRVLNEYNEPMADVTVFGERLDRPGGTRTVTSDDRGDFRLFDVTPGPWRVCGRPQPQGFDNPTAGTVLQKL